MSSFQGVKKERGGQKIRTAPWRDVLDQEVLIELKAAAVNPSDVKAILGAMPHAVWPRTPGRDFAGVFNVENELQVRLLDEYAREDAEIRGAALQNLMWDSELPVGAIDVKVMDGWLTLEGYVNHQYQSDAAFDMNTAP